MNVFFTSDNHFGHGNVIRYCARPFSSAEEMDAAMVEAWNARVGPKDLIYHLGDFAFKNEVADIARLLHQLNGRKVFILGNHDKGLRLALKEKPTLAESVHPILEVKLPTSNGPHPTTLCHYAMRTWNRSHHGAWHLYGHSHGTLPDDPTSLSLDVGVDAWNYAPVSLAEIEAAMAKKQFQPRIRREGA